MRRGNGKIAHQSSKRARFKKSEEPKRDGEKDRTVNSQQILGDRKLSRLSTRMAHWQIEIIEDNIKRITLLAVTRQQHDICAKSCPKKASGRPKKQTARESDCVA